MFFKANQHGLSHGALYPLLVLDFSNVNMADAHVICNMEIKGADRSVPISYIVLLLCSISILLSAYWTTDGLNRNGGRNSQ